MSCCPDSSFSFWNLPAFGSSTACKKGCALLDDDDDDDDVIVAMMIKTLLEDDVSRCPLEETLRRCFRENQNVLKEHLEHCKLALRSGPRNNPTLGTVHQPHTLNMLVFVFGFCPSLLFEATCCAYFIYIIYMFWNPLNGCSLCL